jgi:hypothetical protein
MKQPIVVVLLALLSVLSIAYVGVMVGLGGWNYMANYNPTDIPSSIGIVIIMIGWFCAIIGFLSSILFTIWAFVKASEHGAFD